MTADPVQAEENPGTNKTTDKDRLESARDNNDQFEELHVAEKVSRDNVELTE